MEMFTLFNQIDDPATGRPSAYFSRLFVLLTEDSFQYFLLGAEENAIVSLWDYRLKEGRRHPEMIAGIPKLIAGDEILQRKYPSVVVGIDSPFHTLVPSALFDRQHASGLLEMNFRMPPDVEVLTDPVHEMDAYNLYAINTGLLSMVHEQFPASRIFHASTAILYTFAHHLLRLGLKEAFFVHFSGQKADLACYRDGRLQFFNSFPCQGSLDLLYFTLYTLEQLGLRPDETVVHSLGTIGNEAEMTSQLAPYVRKVEPVGRIASLGYGHAFQSLTDSSYQQLFGLTLCGS